MKIYNIVNKPQGIGDDDIDFQELWESGYTAGYESGYTDGASSCFSVDPISVVFGSDGGTIEAELTVCGDW